MQEENKNLEEAFANIFTNTTSATGEEELLRIASKFSRQISAQQIKILLFITDLAITTEDEKLRERLLTFKEQWIELKQYNNSARFVMKALDSISLKKFLGENAIKVNVEK